MSSYTDIMKALIREEGSVLAETAVLLPVFIVLIFGMFDMYRVIESRQQSHIAARNAAWRGEAGGTMDSFLKILRGDGDFQTGLDMLLQTEHGSRTDTVETLLLPHMITRAKVWIDRRVWAIDIGLDKLINDYNSLSGNK